MTKEFDRMMERILANRKSFQERIAHKRRTERQYMNKLFSWYIGTFTGVALAIIFMSISYWKYLVIGFILAYGSITLMEWATK